jgi:hypothetical protein
VLDLSYRRALKLDADQFAVSFDLSELGILAQVKKLMAPYAEDIEADLYKLNMCAPSHPFTTCSPSLQCNSPVTYATASPPLCSATLIFYLRHLRANFTALN